jgi:hypothetical protein
MRSPLRRYGADLKQRRYGEDLRQRRYAQAGIEASSGHQK